MIGNRIAWMGIEMRPQNLLLLIPCTYVVFLGVFFGRGFDVTDEGFYLLNLAQWQSLPVNVSFFGAYLGAPFSWFGGSIWAIRMFGLLLLMTSAYVFALRFYRALSITTIHGNLARSGAIVASCVVVAFYSPFGTLYTPGYNLLSLVLILFATAAALQICGETVLSKGHLTLYGVCMGALVFTKFSSFFAALLAHLLIAVLMGARRRWPVAATLSGAALAGVLVNYLFLGAIAGDVLAKLGAGTQYMQVLRPRSVVGETLRLFVLDIPRIVLGSITRTWPILVIAAVVLRLRDGPKKWGGWAVVLIVVAAFGPWGFMSTSATRNSAVWMTIFALCILYWPMLREMGEPLFTRAGAAALMAVVALLPVAHAFGTGNDMRLATAMGVVFPVAVCVGLLMKLYSVLAIKGWVFWVCMGSIALAPLQLIAAPWSQKAYTYRLPSGLNEQNVGVSIGNSVISVDAKTAGALRDFQAKLNELGFKAGMPMLDMTGGAPGLIFVANGRPLGGAWMLGGYSGSQAGARNLLEHVSADDIRAAWILSSPDHFLRLDWKVLITERLGTLPFRRAASVQLPLVNFGSNSSQPTAIVEVWVNGPDFSGGEVK
jgi:hypothetical protein